MSSFFLWLLKNGSARGGAVGGAAAGTGVAGLRGYQARASPAFTPSCPAAATSVVAPQVELVDVHGRLLPAALKSHVKVGPPNDR